MHPDYAATCDATPIIVTAALVTFVYLSGTILYFSRQISGVD